MQYLASNEEALKKFSETYPKIQDAFSDDPAGAINYLRLLGFKCANCGGSVTWPIVKFFNYSANARCYKCQKTNSVI